MHSTRNTDLLYLALRERIGLIVKCKDADKFVHQLYRARKTDELFTKLSFVISPINPKTEVWILKKVISDAA